MTATTEGTVQPPQAFVVTTPPHVKAEADVQSIMSTVCIALIPAFLWALYIFGWYAWVVTGLCVASCVVTEAVCQRLRRRTVTVNDYSAVLTGLLLAAVIPPNVAWYVPVLGGIFAIGIAKQAFGGLGHNIWNPALLSRAFLQAAMPTQINSGSWPYLTTGGGLGDIVENASTSLAGSFEQLSEIAKTSPDIVSRATALTKIQLPVVDSVTGATGAGGVFAHDWKLVTASLWGAEGGCIGEVSVLALLIGAALLLYRRIIHWEIPFFYVLTAGVLAWMLPAPYIAQGETLYSAWFSGPWALHLVGGGLVIGAFFMATDYVTSPLSRNGRIIFAIGCGVLTIAIRLYAGYPEGVCYSILLMNTCVPLIDTWTRPRTFGKRNQPKANVG